MLVFEIRAVPLTQVSAMLTLRCADFLALVHGRNYLLVSVGIAAF